MIEDVFEQYTKGISHGTAFIAALIAEIRPPKPSQSVLAVKSIQALCFLLQKDLKKARLLREVILQLLRERKPISLFLIARHSAFSGFFTELRRRFSHKILPEAIDTAYLIDLFSTFFPKSTDELWILAVPDSVWEELIISIRFDEASSNLKEPCRQNLLEATQVLSYRIAALGLEPELLRSHPELEQHNSPFIAQQEALALFLTANSSRLLINASLLGEPDIRNILVMLDQCNEVIRKIRLSCAQTGTSIRLTFLLLRMSQQIARLETLLIILDHWRMGAVAHIEMIKLFKELVYSECHKNDLLEHWRENIEVMALRVTENASRAGEHYITENRAEYFQLMRSAMGAGIIIALMALIKLMLAKQHIAPLTEAILFSFNYGLGFILIHILHFTVATKQPAMTAAAIAVSMDPTNNQSIEMDNLVRMIAKTMRSQIVAIFGNVVLAVPIAMSIAWGIFHLSGLHFINQDKARQLLSDIDPIHSGALFYAAIAGVCLFLAGLIAGYHDNLSVYNKIPQRLRALGWLKILLGENLLDRVAEYVENNLGALAGNFYFGCLLGGMSAIGVLFGLPFDIRHVAFSSAFFGYALVALDFMLTWQAVGFALLGLVLIGFMNLAVSFSLALYIAMKSRKVRFKQWRLLIGILFSRLNHHLGEFILPPKLDTEKNIN